MEEWRKLKAKLKDMTLNLTEPCAKARGIGNQIKHREHIQVIEFHSLLKEGHIVMQLGQLRTDMIEEAEEVINYNMGDLEISVEFDCRDNRTLNMAANSIDLRILES